MNEPMIAFLAILLFIIIMTGMIGEFVSRSRKRRDAGSTLGLGELEARIQRAVESANEPLREEIRELRGELEKIEPQRSRKQVEGGAVSERGLLA